MNQTLIFKIKKLIIPYYLESFIALKHCSRVFLALDDFISLILLLFQFDCYHKGEDQGPSFQRLYVDIEHLNLGVHQSVYEHQPFIILCVFSCLISVPNKNTSESRDIL